ncbi:hypothetical protein [Clostridium minihomine]|uniref:hypothetical protein n=1 Tax=Clostridium minihomine TaxID=2045012 RepID=UPI000C771A14|nr:hypothetical protein [Clostridium minihomine]
MANQSRSKRKIMRGYDKLAFGGISDAVRLMFCENMDVTEIENMDLFNVAEIKRPKGGGMEIRFFDRIKALQCLEQISDEQTGGLGEFYRALEQSVRCFDSADPKED